LTKTGAGRLILSGSNTYTGPTTITAGRLALGANQVLPDGSAVAIGNATLDAAAFTDTVGTLEITGTATIHLESGAALAFADSSTIDWTGGTLNLTGTFVSGASLRFGTSNTGLTATQLAKISGSGLSSFALNGGGYLTATGGNAFDSWANGTFANGALSDTTLTLDFDGGGLATAIEWVLGGDPTTGGDDAGKAPTCDLTTDPAYLTYTYRRSDAANADPNTSIQVEYGSDLGGWTSAVAGADVIITESDDFYGTGIDQVEVRIKRSSFGDRIFTRLKVAVAP
ncbi:MAG: hypothetical protein RLZZ214_3342, partial [Verrucomicrobiota bacterium]